MKKINQNLELILSLLTPFNNPVIPVTRNALIYYINPEEIDNFYKFLLNPKTKSRADIERPKCPVISPHHFSVARAPYKNAMGDYISQWGYTFENPVHMVSSILEATANYLEKKK